MHSIEHSLPIYLNILDDGYLTAYAHIEDLWMPFKLPLSTPRSPLPLRSALRAYMRRRQQCIRKNI